MANTSGINPTEYNVLVEVIEVETKSKGGIDLPDSVIARKQAMATRARLIAVSPLAFSYERWPEGTTPPQVGDTVVITKAAGVEVEGLDGKIYKMLKDKDVGAVMDDRIKAAMSLMESAKTATFNTDAIDAEIAALNKEAADV